MGSVIDSIECPNCKLEAHSDFYYKTGEEYISCLNCGYSYSATIINRDKKLSQLQEEDWCIREIKNPYGAFKLKTYQSIAYECGLLETEEEYKDLKSLIEEDLEIEFCSVSRVVDGKPVIEILVDNGPDIDSAGFSEEDR